MEPITATIVVCLAIGWATQAAGKGVAHAAAGIRGKPSPVIKDWDKHEHKRRAAGHPARERPKTIWGTAWANAIEKTVLKMEQRHHGKMGALRDLGPNVSDKARKRLLWRANLRAKLAAKASTWFGTGRERFARIAGDIRQVVDEKRAEYAARRAGREPEQPAEDRQKQAADALADGEKSQTPSHQDPDQGQGQQGQGNNEEQDAKVLPFQRRSEEPTESTVDNSERTESPQVNGENGNTGGTDTMTATQTQSNTTLPEPTDLPTAIHYAEVVGSHLGTLGDKVADDAAIYDNNAQALADQVAAIETGQAALTGLGFTGGAVQNGLAKAAELAPVAAGKFAEMQRLAQELGEQLQEIRDAMTGVAHALKSQSGLADEAQSQESTNGVANQTQFYLEG